MAVIEDVRPLGAGLERSYQVYVRGRLKFRVKQIVYVAFSLDESVMGFAFPKEERPTPASSSSTLGAWSSPRSFPLPTPSPFPTARPEAAGARAPLPPPRLRRR